MCEKFHLPVAAALSDLNGLSDFGETSLSGMAAECARWLDNTMESRASIVTPAAKTLWAVLVQGEVDHVAETHRCLLDELSNRFSSEEELA